MEQNVQFQVGKYHEQFQLDQIQNDLPASTFDFNMRKNWKTVPDSWTITIEQNLWLHEKFQHDHIYNGRPAVTFDFNMRNNWKTVPDI